MTARRNELSDGLYDRERNILALWDNGFSKQQIVAEGYPKKLVNNVLGSYVSGDETRHFFRDACEGSRALCARILEIHPHARAAQ